MTGTVGAYRPSQSPSNSTATLLPAKPAAHRFPDEKILLRLLLDKTDQGVLITDGEHRIVHFNPAAERLFRRPASNTLGLSLSYWAEVSGLPWPRFRQALDTARKKGEDRFHVERMRNRSPYSLEFSVFTMHKEGGDFAGACLLVRDTSELRRVESLLEHAQKMGEVGTLAGGIAHDFNNVLQAIGGFTQLLLLDRGREDPDRPLLLEIQKACSRGGELVRQLSGWSRKAETLPRLTDLNEEVIQSCRFLERVLPAEIRVETHLEPHLNPVRSGPTHIMQILMNLGNNAADAMPDGGRIIVETKRIRLEERNPSSPPLSPGEYALLTVRDTGHGMEPETLKHIFDPFFTTKHPGQGTGLGLSMVKEIVKRLDGTITCMSSPGYGTSFHIYLPAHPPDARSRHPAVISEHPKMQGIETILLVDDERPLLEIGKKVLLRFGYSVLEAESGEAALEIVRQGKTVDLVVLDLSMPGIGGMKCLEELLKLDPTLKVVVVSGYSSEREIQKVLQAGALDFLAKPYRMTRLLSTVRTVLDGKTPGNATGPFLNPSE